MTRSTLPRFVLILMEFDSSMLDAGLEMRELNATLFFQQTLLLSCGRDKNNFPPSALLITSAQTHAVSADFSLFALFCLLTIFFNSLFVRRATLNRSLRVFNDD